MQKIMFNDTYGLTTAVLQRRKTKTRRLCKERATNELIPAADVESYRYYPEENLVEFLMQDGSIKVSVPPYKIGEVMAVAQSYGSILNEVPDRIKEYVIGFYSDSRAWNNKMFVRADLMPHQIRITDIKVERLQDISDEDIIKEGVEKGMYLEPENVLYYFDEFCGFFRDGQVRMKGYSYKTAREAFAALIDKVGGKGTWERNPYVFAYEFELVK